MHQAKLVVYKNSLKTALFCGFFGFKVTWLKCPDELCKLTTLTNCNSFSSCCRASFLKTALVSGVLWNFYTDDNLMIESGALQHLSAC